MIIILLYALLMQSEVDVNLKKLACVTEGEYIMKAGRERRNPFLPC